MKVVADADIFGTFARIERLFDEIVVQRSVLSELNRGDYLARFGGI
jgi:hypothetical protein